jgi:hypothetical protein
MLCGAVSGAKYPQSEAIVDNLVGFHCRGFGSRQRQAVYEFTHIQTEIKISEQENKNEQTFLKMETCSCF